MTAAGRRDLRLRLRRSERGSVLALVPAAFLVLMALAALAVDSAVAYQAQAQLHDDLLAAANDAASAGLSNASFYAGHGVTLDPATVATVVCQSVTASGVASSLHHLHLAVAVAGDAVEVTATASVDPVFGRIVPGLSTRSVRSTAAAALVRGPTLPAAAFGPPQPVSCTG